MPDVECAGTTFLRQQYVAAGLVVIAAAFFALQGHIDLEAVGHYGETCVGFLMVALGFWAAQRSLVRYRKSTPDAGAKQEATPKSTLDEVEEGTMENELQPMMISESTELLEPARAASSDRVLSSWTCCG
eukprot:COSAG02_NODE_7999_length_2753_cov_1.885079_2_plen_129_part_01